MVDYHAALLFALAVGFVSSGLVGNFWAVLTDEEPRFANLLDPAPDLLTPFRIVAVVCSAPTSLLLDGFGWATSRPVVGLLVMLFALGWSLMQGTFILTQVLGLN